MACHGELARPRPPAQHLPGFYDALSLGGMMGGLCAGLIAPFSFSWIAEYPIPVALAALCRRGNQAPAPRWGRWYWGALTLLAVMLIAPSYLSGEAAQYLDHFRMPIISAVAIAAMIAAIILKVGRWKFSATIGLALRLIGILRCDRGPVETFRRFFGVHKIGATTDGRYHRLMHRTTVQ